MSPAGVLLRAIRTGVALQEAFVPLCRSWIERWGVRVGLANVWEGFLRVLRGEG